MGRSFASSVTHEATLSGTCKSSFACQNPRIMSATEAMHIAFFDLPKHQAMRYRGILDLRLQLAHEQETFLIYKSLGVQSI